MICCWVCANPERARAQRASAPTGVGNDLSVVPKSLCKLFSPSVFCLRQKPPPSSEGGIYGASGCGCPADTSKRSLEAPTEPAGENAAPYRFAHCRWVCGYFTERHRGRSLQVCDSPLGCAKIRLYVVYKIRYSQKANNARRFILRGASFRVKVYFVILSLPPIYIRNGSGILTVPSAFRLFSRKAISILGGATTVLFKVWAK